MILSRSRLGGGTTASTTAAGSSLLGQQQHNSSLHPKLQSQSQQEQMQQLKHCLINGKQRMMLRMIVIPEKSDDMTIIAVVKLISFMQSALPCP
jgi:hypothetical protein